MLQNITQQPMFVPWTEMSSWQFDISALGLLIELWVDLVAEKAIGISQSTQYIQALAHSSHLHYPFSIV